VSATYRDERLGVVAEDAVRRELGIIQHCLEVARSEWDTPLRTNPVKLIALPPSGEARERRLQEGEENRLFQAIPKRNTYLRPMLVLALESAMMHLVSQAILRKFLVCLLICENYNR
jgi:hypothetical protein